jgi:hypothetical protein
METSVIWIIVIAVLFVLVWLNHKRNMKKLRRRSKHDFHKGYRNKRNN